ncbi:MAG: hypothetical protein B7Z15_07345 [Rhizobiales bacterium 32-66-8]|nr:MAG: hypothetical protein B7Z15_07345 [Rhizobiales bacterium 32-66-8]
MGLGAAGIGGAGIVGVLAGIKAAVSDVAAMSAEAKRAGIGVEAFQELKFAAEQARVGVDGLADGIKEMQLRADEFIVTGAGGGAEAFQRLGYTAEELKAKLADPAALFGDVIERLRELDKASQIRVSDEIFGGTGGEQFVRFLDQGRNSLSRLRQEAREAGAVLDSELVKSAEEIDRKFMALTTTIGTRLKGAVLELVEALKKVPTAEDWARGAPEPMAGPVNPTRRATPIDIGVPVLGPSAGVPIPTPRPQGIAGQGDTSSIKRAGESAATLKRGYADLQAAARGRIADMQTEQAALGMTTQAAAAYRFEQDAIADAARMQITLTPQQREELAGLANEYGVVSAAIEDSVRRQQDVMQLQGELGSIASSSLSGLISGTQTWSDSLANLSSRLADLVLQAALLGDGPLGGMFGAGATSKGAGGLVGSLFSAFTGAMPKAAKGGILQGPTIAGEAGPEAAVPLPDGRRIPVDLRGAIKAPQAAQQNLRVDVNVQTLPGTTAEVKERQNADGSVSLDVIMRQVTAGIASDLESRGAIARKLEGGYNLKRNLG